MNISHGELLNRLPNKEEVKINRSDSHFLNPVAFGLVRGVLVSALGADYPYDQECFRRASVCTVLKVLGMPGFLRLAMIVLSIVFDGCGIFFGGKLFRYLSMNDQMRQIKVWQKSSIGPCRDLMMFYQKMGVFIYFSLVDSSQKTI